MKKTMHILLLTTICGLFTLPSIAEESTPLQEEQSDRAKILLKRAVEHLKSNGEKALAAFSQASRFTDDKLYVYVLNKNGVIEASGGASYNLIGRNVLDYEDTDGKKLFIEIIDQASENGKGSVSYRWLNLQSGKVEPKTAYFEEVGDLIVSVGFYTPRGSEAQARSMLWRAVDELDRRGEQAFEEFNKLSGSFILDDTYVFVVDIENEIMRAHGAMPRLIDRKVGSIKDVDGKPIMQLMLDMLKSDEEGELEYRWQNPVTGEIENKHTFVRRSGNYMVAVGYYHL